MTLAYLMLMAAPAMVSVTIAPDQPLPYVYIDDPLIVEFYSDTEIDVDVRLSLQAMHTSEHVEIDLGRIHLHSESGYWYAVHDAPRQRGFYTAEIVMTVGDETQTARADFCRIDRQTSLHRLPVYAYCGGFDEACALPALRGVGLDTVRGDIDNVQFEELAGEVSAFGVRLIVAMTLKQALLRIEADAALIQAQCENILRFEISCDPIEQECVNLADALRKLGCSASASIVVADALAFEEMLRANPDLTARHTTVMGADWPDLYEIAAIRHIAARHGQEGWQIHVLCPEWHPRNAGEAVRFIHAFLRYRAAGVSDIGINAAAVADDVNVQHLMSYLNGLALHFGNHTYIGTLLLDNDVQAPVFRRGAHWFIPLWSDTGYGAVAVSVDGTVGLELTDAMGNDTALPEINDGALEMRVGLEPLYLTGSGGVILGRAALERVEELCKSITESPELSGFLSQGILELIAGIREEPRGAGSRLRFLELLRVLPQIEEQWHTRQMPREIAVPAIAQISELIRALCLVEEDRGERFLEPLADTLARAEELQSLYLTGSAGSAQARERGDWILGEVRRLIDEAEVLDEADRKIEAGAVAALAEWRAHCLIHAARAEPVREDALEMHPFVLPEPTDEEDVDTDEGEDEAEIPAPEEAEEPEELEEGEEPADASEDDEAAPTTSQEIVHTVASGENPYIIARKYNVPLDDLLEWNNLGRNPVLRVGQELIVYVSP